MGRCRCIAWYARKMKDIESSRKTGFLSAEDIEFESICFHSRRRLRQEHAVSVGEEAITCFDCVVVGCKHLLASTEGAYQHQQRGLRKVEVRQECVYDLELVSGRDEDVGCSGMRFEPSIACNTRAVFQRANRGRACCDDSATFALRRVYRFCCGVRQGVAFGVQVNVFDLSYPYWLEGS